MEKENLYLFFDTETTGLPNNWGAPTSDAENWPRMVQLAYLFCEEGGHVISMGNFIMKPDGYKIPEGASKVHGITTEIAEKRGVLVHGVLKNLNSLIWMATHLVAHNIDFDKKIVGAEFLRAKMRDVILTRELICTMKSSTDFCEIPGMRGGYKWPKLVELHTKLFDKGFEDAHDAFADIKATAKCFWELKKRGIIALSPEPVEVK